VTTPDGTSSASSADQFTYLPVPTLTGISPNSGPTSGGTVVVISGSDFSGVTGVKFGTTDATSFELLVSGDIEAISPPGSAGTVDITVTTPYGTSSISSADQFRYYAKHASWPLIGGIIGAVVLVVAAASIAVLSRRR